MNVVSHQFPCARCRTSRFSLEAACTECGWAPAPQDNTPISSPIEMPERYEKRTSAFQTASLVPARRNYIIIGVLASVGVIGASVYFFYFHDQGGSKELASKENAKESLSSRSRFLKELATESHRKTDAPAEAPVFRWRFSERKTWGYTYEQKVHSTSNMGDFSSSDAVTGALLIESQGDRTAKLVLKNVKWNSGQVGELTFPPVVLPGMKEDGSATFGNSSQELLLRTLFPLPTSSLAVGESVDLPAQMPFNVMGTLLHVKGRSRITLVGYVNIGDRRCAQLKTDIDISELTIPKGLEGNHRASVRGRSIFFFDVDTRCFVSGTIALLMEMSIDSGTRKTSMVSDNLIRVRLK